MGLSDLPMWLLSFRGDIIIAKSPSDPKMNVCKRVIGLEGDKVCTSSPSDIFKTHTYVSTGNNNSRRSFPPCTNHPCIPRLQECIMLHYLGLFCQAGSTPWLEIGIQMHAPLQLGKCLFRLQLLFQGIMSKEAEDYYVTETAVIAFFYYCCHLCRLQFLWSPLC